MKQTIKAEEQTLVRIFSNDYLFEIPAYQRPYAWTTEEVTELLDDLLTAMGDIKDIEKIEDAPPYFLGSIVLIKDTAHAPAEVVDGQQRLTTLTILFCVLRELCENNDNKADLDGYVRQRGSMYKSTEDRFRLSLRERDRMFFEENIQATGQLSQFLEQDNTNRTDSEQRMYENAKYLWEQLSYVGQSNRNLLTAFLIQRCHLVVVSASDQDSAYRIFSVMNDRGMDLSPTDILKAGIIGEMPDKSRSTYTDQWEKIEEDLGREGFRNLFTHIRIIYMKSKARGNLNQEFKDGVLSKINGNGQKFIDNVLTPFSEAYEIISRAAYESTGDAERVNAYLRHLGRLDNNDWIPPAIKYFERHRNDENALFRFFP